MRWCAALFDDIEPILFATHSLRWGWIQIHPVLGSCVFFRSGKNLHEPNPQHLCHDLLSISRNIFQNYTNNYTNWLPSFMQFVDVIYVSTYFVFRLTFSWMYSVFSTYSKKCESLRNKKNTSTIWRTKCIDKENGN